MATLEEKVLRCVAMREGTLFQKIEKSERAAREWSTVVIVIVVFIS